MATNPETLRKNTDTRFDAAQKMLVIERNAKERVQHELDVAKLNLNAEKMNLAKAQEREKQLSLQCEKATAQKEEIQGELTKATKLLEQANVELAQAKADLKRALDDNQNNKKRADQLQATVVEYKQHAESQARQQAQQPQQPPKPTGEEKFAADRGIATAAVADPSKQAPAPNSEILALKQELVALRAQNASLQRDLTTLTTEKEIHASQNAQRSQTLIYLERCKKEAKELEDELRAKLATVEATNAELEARSKQLEVVQAGMLAQWTAQYIAPLQQQLTETDKQLNYFRVLYTKAQQQLELLQLQQQQFTIAELTLKQSVTARELELVQIRLQCAGAEQKFVNEQQRSQQLHHQSLQLEQQISELRQALLENRNMPSPQHPPKPSLNPPAPIHVHAPAHALQGFPHAAYSPHFSAGGALGIPVPVPPDMHPNMPDHAHAPLRGPQSDYLYFAAPAAPTPSTPLVFSTFEVPEMPTLPDGFRTTAAPYDKGDAACAEAAGAHAKDAQTAPYAAPRPEDPAVPQGPTTKSVSLVRFT